MLWTAFWVASVDGTDDDPDERDSGGWVLVPRAVVVWECGICGGRFPTKEQAAAHEQRGLAPLYPVGMMYALDQRLYAGMVFAVAAMERDGHGYGRNVGWACRDVGGYGDTIADGEYCGGPGWNRLLPPDPSLPAFQRMIAALREKGIEPTVWDGERPVPLEEFLAGRAAGADGPGAAGGRGGTDGGSS